MDVTIKYLALIELLSVGQFAQSVVELELKYMSHKVPGEKESLYSLKWLNNRAGHNNIIISLSAPNGFVKVDAIQVTRHVETQTATSTGGMKCFVLSYE